MVQEWNKPFAIVMSASLVSQYANGSSPDGRMDIQELKYQPEPGTKATYSAHCFRNTTEKAFPGNNNIYGWPEALKVVEPLHQKTGPMLCLVTSFSNRKTSIASWTEGSCRLVTLFWPGGPCLRPFPT